MNKLILNKVLIFFALTCYQSFAQVIRVIDCESKEVIPYFACFDASTNTFVYQGGEDGEILMRTLRSEDLIRIKAFGYHDKILKIDSTNKQIVCLQKKEVVLQEVNVRYQNKLYLGIQAKKSSSCSFVMKIGNDKNYRRGLFFENTDTIYIDEIAFFVNRGSKKGSPFRAVIHEGSLQIINEDADSNVIFSEPQKVTCRNCWHTIHLSESIMITENFLVALEWLPNNTEVGIGYNSDEFHGLKLGTQADHSFVNVLSINFDEWKEVQGMRCNSLKSNMASPMIRVKIRK